MRNVKKHNYSATLNFFQPLLNLSENWLLVTSRIYNYIFGDMHNKFAQDTWKTFLMLSRPQGENIDVKCENCNKRPSPRNFRGYSN